MDKKQKKTFLPYFLKSEFARGRVSGIRCVRVPAAVIKPIVKIKRLKRIPKSKATGTSRQRRETRAPKRGTARKVKRPVTPKPSPRPMQFVFYPKCPKCRLFMKQQIALHKKLMRQQRNARNARNCRRGTKNTKKTPRKTKIGSKPQQRGRGRPAKTVFVKRLVNRGQRRFH